MEESNSLSDAYLIDPYPSENVNTTQEPMPNMTLQPARPNGTVDALVFEHYVRIIVPTIFGVICLLGLFGNFLVIMVVIFNKHMRNTTNILILSLAVADLLFILFCVPFTATGYALPVWPFGDIGCKVQSYAMYVCAYASVYTLVLMSLDRYLAVVHAIRSMTWRSERNTWFAIAVVWIIILCGNTPLLVQFGEKRYVYEKVENRSACLNLVDLEDASVGKAFFGCFLFFGYIIPLGVTVLLYSLMLKRLLYGVVPGGRNQSAESIRAKKRVTRMVVIVVVIFALCWLPIQIILFWQKFGNYPMHATYIGTMMAANCLAYMNSCVNPILYAFLSENFRRSFRKFLCCSETSRRMDYERTNVRFTTCEKETVNTCVSNNKTYTPV
ncbi:allatostatin-A receptor [Aplysia californica]|uniref:Allatostatin-A receptor n=1 Tax=Aplysia californica TaxID=6500 RepID=A0ABM0JNP1_APLCA|nr:allatostatin-A receptor [Aplysia californica]XP_035825554.1 allatostatin-A receptor [Aplysia californica]